MVGHTHTHTSQHCGCFIYITVRNKRRFLIRQRSLCVLCLLLLLPLFSGITSNMVLGFCGACKTAAAAAFVFGVFERPASICLVRACRNGMAVLLFPRSLFLVPLLSYRFFPASHRSSATFPPLFLYLTHSPTFFSPVPVFLCFCVSVSLRLCLSVSLVSLLCLRERGPLFYERRSRAAPAAPGGVHRQPRPRQRRLGWCGEGEAGVEEDRGRRMEEGT